MAVARIRTSDPEVVEFLSRHLASSGYKLEFVRPGEPVQGDADLEIDASRMDLESAMAAAQQERGLVTVLNGVLKADARRDIFEEAAQTASSHEYAEVSPYARGAELQDEPSGLHKTVDAVSGALSAGMLSLGQATKGASARFEAWRAQREAERTERERQREREMEIEAARRRGEELRRAEEETKRKADEARRRAEEERVAAIRREEMARVQAEERRQRDEQARLKAEAERARLQEEQRLEAEAARQRAEQERRLQAEAAQRQAEQQARWREEQERRRAQEERRIQEEARLRAEAEERRQAEILTGIERQRREEVRLSEEAKPYEDERQRDIDETVLPASRPDERVEAAAVRDESPVEADAATVEDVVAEKEWHEASVPTEARNQPIAPTPTWTYQDRRRRPRRIGGQRERAFKRSAVAAAVVALGVISVWSVAAMRRPANPLSREQLVRSAAVEQQRPFGPAATVAPVTKPESPMAPRATPSRRMTAKKPSPTPRGRAARPHATNGHVAKKTSSDEAPDVVVHHFAATKQESAKVKVKNGIKVISESD